MIRVEKTPEPARAAAARRRFEGPVAEGRPLRSACAVAAAAAGYGRVAAGAVLLVMALQGCSAKTDETIDDTSVPPIPPAVASAAAKPSADSADSKVLGGLVAVVDGNPITLRELRDYQRTAVFLPPEMRSDFQAMLQSMIERQLLLAEFEKNGIKVSDEMVERYIEGILQQNGQTRAQVEKAVADAGLKWSDYFERMREEVQRLSLINMLIRARVNVTPEEVERAWKSDPAFMQSEKLELAEIFLPLPADPEAAAAVRLQAVEVEREARRNFADAARKYSKGPGAAEGGQLGEFERGTMAAHFEKATAGLGKGDISQPIEGAGGLHIVKVSAIHSKGRQPLEEVSKQIHDKLYEKRLEERYRKWVTEDLRAEHRVEILLDDLALVAGS